MRMVIRFKFFFSKNSLGCPTQPEGTRRCFDFPRPRIPPVGGPHANLLIKTTSLVEVYQKGKSMSNLMVKLPYLMENIILENLLKSILIGEKIIKIDDKIFPITGMIGQGYHKQVFEIDDEKNDKVIKIVRKDAKNIVNAFLSFKQAIENQKVLEELGLNYTKIVDFDKNNSYYRYLIQEKIPSDGVCVAELIKDGELKENDIYQIAKIINKLEINKKWQLDMSPFNWFKVGDKLVYTGGTVYVYDEHWAFVKVGLIQWIDPKFVKESEGQSTKIPSEQDKKEFIVKWNNLDTAQKRWWKKYLGN